MEIIFDDVTIELEGPIDRFLPWRIYDAYTPAGVTFGTTGCHTWGAAGNKTDIRKGLRQYGLGPCELSDCDICENN